MARKNNNYLTNQQFHTQMREITLNAMTSRLEWIKRLSDRRDMDSECRYPDVITPDDYRKSFDRNGIANRVCSIECDESWKVLPEVFDSEDSDETPFEQALKVLNKRISILSYLHRVDVLSGIGRYGVILLGIGDKRPLEEPVRGIEDDSIFDEDFKQVPEKKLLFMRAFDESMVRISEWENDTSNPRYGHPRMYSLNMLDPDILNIDGRNAASGKESGGWSKVHWTRMLHFADNRLTSEVYAPPRQQSVWNFLFNIQKILGAGGEGFWQSAFGGISFETQPGLENIELDVPGLKKQVKAYMEGFQRYLMTSGMNVKSLAPQITDPSSHFETQLKAITITKGIPYRIFLGTEEAKLASTQDKSNWAERMTRRCENYLSPYMVRPTYDRLILAGVLPAPQKNEYDAHWTDLSAPSEDEEAATATKIVTALKTYVDGGVNEMMTPEDFLTIVMRFEPDEVKTILDNAMGQIEAEEAGETVVLGGPSEEEIAQKALADQAMKDVQKAGGKIPKNILPEKKKGLVKNSLLVLANNGYEHISITTKGHHWVNDSDGDPRLMTDEQVVRMAYNFNPNHDPDDGKFSSGPGGDGTRVGGSSKRWNKEGKPEEGMIDEWTNDATRFREMDEKDSSDPQLEALLRELTAKPKYDGLAYRGLILDNNTADTFLKAKSFSIKGLSSFSKGKAMAAQYADPAEIGEGGVGVVIRTRLKDARDINSNGEVVTRRANFKIVSVLKMEDHYLVTADQE